MIPKEGFSTLHRSYIWANRMRTHFDNVLQRCPQEGITQKEVEIEALMYMSLWYGLTVVVIEGWEKLKLEDTEIEALLASKKTQRLKKYRHAVFHFPPNGAYFDGRMEDFFKEKSTVEWIRNLNSAFGRYFLERLSPQ